MLPSYWNLFYDWRSHGYGTYEGKEQESIAALNRALELGCTFWDTADV